MDFDYDPQEGTTQNVRVALTKERRISRLGIAEALLRHFSSGERLLLYALSICLGLSMLAILSGINSLVSVEVPTLGGSLTEGEVGSARFLNPVLTLSGPDEDITEL